jgi:hypothetical protein
MARNLKKQSDDKPDIVWGAEAIGTVINRTAAQTRYLIETGALDGAVEKVGHRTFVGFPSKLREKLAPSSTT